MATHIMAETEAVVYGIGHELGRSFFKTAMNWGGRLRKLVENRPHVMAQLRRSFTESAVIWHLFLDGHRTIQGYEKSLIHATWL